MEGSDDSGMSDFLSSVLDSISSTSQQPIFTNNLATAHESISPRTISAVIQHGAEYSKLQDGFQPTVLSRT